MELINGVSFEDWAAACANLAQGMPEAEILDILGLELPVWQKTMEAWTNKLGDLMAEDMNVATTYGEIFSNPKVGKFADVASSVPELSTLLKKVPDYDTYQKIMAHQSIASQHGVDPITILQQYDINLQHWGQLGMHYSKWFHEYVDHKSPYYQERFEETSAIMAKWDDHWKTNFKEDAVDLGEDIDF